MNTFKYLTGPCLVCGGMPHGTAHGITPDKAVCDKDWTENHAAALDALDNVADPTTTKPSVSVSDLTIEDVLAAVESGDISAANALAAERSGKNRVSLIRQLKAIQNQAESKKTNDSPHPAKRP